MNHDGVIELVGIIAAIAENHGGVGGDTELCRTNVAVRQFPNVCIVANAPVNRWSRRHDAGVGKLNQVVATLNHFQDIECAGNSGSIHDESASAFAGIEVRVDAVQHGV